MPEFKWIYDAPVPGPAKVNAVLVPPTIIDSRSNTITVTFQQYRESDIPGGPPVPAGPVDARKFEVPPDLIVQILDLIEPYAKAAGVLVPSTRVVG